MKPYRLIWLAGLLLTLAACSQDDALTGQAAGADGNLIRNGDFSEGQDGWGIYANRAAEVSYTQGIDAGRYCVEVEASGDRAWDVFLHQKKLNLQEGVTYDLTFDVTTRQGEAADFTAKVGQTRPPYMSYHRSWHVSGDGRQTKTAAFTVPTSDANAKLEFHLGANAGSRDYCFDKVSLRARNDSSDPAQGERDPLKQPFASDSIWNMPLHKDARYVPGGIEPAKAYGMTVDEDIIILRPDAPRRRIIDNTAGWDDSKTRCGTTTGEDLYDDKSLRVPVPDDFRTDPGYDGTTPNHSGAILMPDGRTLKQTQPLHICGYGGVVTSGYAAADVDLYGQGVRGAHGGSALSSIGGTLRLGELVPGATLRHALKLNLYSGRFINYRDDGTRGYRWPALWADFYAAESYRGSVPELEMGALLALKPEFDVESLRTEPAKILARAFQDYGGYLVDDTGWDVYALETEWSPDGRMTDEFEETWGWSFATDTLASCQDESEECAWAKDMADIFTALHVIDNNSPETKGGGSNEEVGTRYRRAPQAPSLSQR